MRVTRQVYNDLCNLLRDQKLEVQIRIGNKETKVSLARSFNVPVGTFEDACAKEGIELPKRPAPAAKVNGSNGGDSRDRWELAMTNLTERVAKLERDVRELNPGLL